MDFFDENENKKELSENPCSNEKLCRYCYDTENEDQLISPCKCQGSLEFVHFHCLKDWLTISGTTSCQVCGDEYDLDFETKPFLKWSYSGKVNLILLQNMSNVIAAILGFLISLIILSIIYLTLIKRYDEKFFIASKNFSVLAIIFTFMESYPELCRIYQTLKHHNRRIIRISGRAEE